MSPLLAAWLLLAVSVACEVVGNVALRYADGFTRPIAATAAVTCFLASVWLMSITMRKIELGVTYAVWAAGSTAITVCVGVGLYDESLTGSKVAGVALVVLGVIVLSSGAG
jgi:small multidrug resistance pump